MNCPANIIAAVWRGIAISLALAVAIWAAMPTHVQVQATQQSTIGHKENEDLDLYAAIIGRVSNGEDYYEAAAEEQRANHFPLKPFVTMRMPTLAVMTASLGSTLTTTLMAVIAITLILVWWQRFDGAFRDRGRRISATLMIAVGAVLAVRSDMILVHDMWAGMLIALSIGLYDRRRYAAAIAIGVIACLIRELALPYLMLMTTMALFRRDWREAVWWAGGIALVSCALFAHAQMVASVVQPGDLSSPGWSSFGGWAMAVRSLRLTTAARAFPEIAGITIVVFSLTGWLSWRSLHGYIVSLLLAGYTLMFCLFGRPENFYWAMITAPLLLVGLIFVLDRIMDLLSEHQAVNDKPSVIPTH